MKVSVIVPVYEPSARIEGCLVALSSQTLGDIEAVMVDDRGTDGSFDRVRKFVAGYDGPVRFKLLEMPSNSGPSAARNAALDVAEGEFVAFLDSDDRIAPTFCEKLYDAATAARADIACCDILISWDGRGTVHTNPAVTGGQFTIGLHKTYLRHFVSYFTTYIYRRAMLDEYGIRFPDTRSAEDSCFLACAIMAAKRIAQVREPLYIYEKHDKSVSGRHDRLRGLDRLRSFRAMRRWAREYGMGVYSPQMTLISLKKGWALALRDLITG